MCFHPNLPNNKRLPRSVKRLIKFDGPHQTSGMAPPLAADGDGQKNSRKIKRLRDVSCMRKRETKQVRRLSVTQIELLSPAWQLIFIAEITHD